MAEKEQAIYQLKTTIAGIDYVLKSDRPDEEMQEIVDYVSQELDNFSGHGRFNQMMKTTLACINITDELFSERKKLEKQTEKLAESREENQALQDEIKNLKRDLEIRNQTAQDKEKDLDSLKKTLEAMDKKLADLSRQLQSYQRGRR